MKALTVRQPYALAIVLGYLKEVSQPCGTEYRGPLLIRSAKKKKVRPIYNGSSLFPGFPKNAEYLHGCLIGLVDLVDVVHAKPDDPGTGRPLIGGGGSLWRFDNPRIFKYPMPWTGPGRFFEVPDNAFLANTGLPWAGD